MSGSLNKAMLIGNLGRDPEIRTTPSGAKVANFSLATNESYTDRNGQRVDKTEWHRVVMWRGLADVAERYLRKGSNIYIEGKISTRSWDDQNGQKRYTTEIVADNMQMLGGRRDNSESSGDPGYGQMPAENYQQPSPGGYSQPDPMNSPADMPRGGLGAMPPAPEDDLPF